MMNLHGLHFGGMHWIWWVICAIVLIGIISFIIQSLSFNNETPMQILKRRFAKGEISKHEFEELKKVLNTNK
jgi:putative membrane protein